MHCTDVEAMEDLVLASGGWKKKASLFPHEKNAAACRFSAIFSMLIAEGVIRSPMFFCTGFLYPCVIFSCECLGTLHCGCI